MTLTLPLAWRLKYGTTEKYVTGRLRDLEWRSEVSKGHGPARGSLEIPLSQTDAAIGYYGAADIIDIRHMGVLWSGRLEDPSRSVGPDGQVWELVGMGTGAHASDRQVPYIMVDRDLTNLLRSGITNKKAARVDHTDSDADPEVPAVNMVWPEGTTVQSTAPASRIVAMYRPIYDAGMKLGRVRVLVIDGATTGNRENQIRTRIAPSGSSTVADSATWSTTQATLACARGGSPNITSNHDVADLCMQIVAGGTVTVGDTAWGEYYDFVIRSLLMDASGNEILSGYSANTVLASEVVKDMLGRFLTGYDGPAARVDTSSFAIEQLAYLDPVTMAQVLEDLIVLEGDWYWAAWERNAYTGKIRFEFRPWPTDVAYEADIRDGYNSTGSAAELFNAVRVRYKDTRGRIRSRLRTQTVPDLDAAGLTRTAFLDLADEIGQTAAMADRAGDQFLIEHRYPPNAGTLRVARRIWCTGDAYGSARYLEPWEVQPGYLLRARGILPRIDALNTTTRDGVTVFKVVAKSFNTNDPAAMLDLDSNPPTLAHQIAKVTVTRKRRR